ncbi:MAG: xylulokinase [Candidatus Heimdallarchaeota archaeon]|nr:xylulokinase [Candidatus Heimdallarchaeota archaeon]
MKKMFTTAGLVIMEYLLSIDIGTTGGRSIIFDLNGQIIASAHEEYSCLFPSPTCVEQYAMDWWRIAKTTIKSVLQQSQIAPSKLLGTSVTNQRETIVPVDEEGIPLSKAIVWQDRRTIKECREIEEKIGTDRIYDITGLTIDPYFSAPKILWMKKNWPKVFREAYKFLLVHDFIQQKLTDEFITDYSNASRTMLFDIGSLTWSDKVLDLLEIPKEKLPEALPSGRLVGEVTTKAAEETGLPHGLPVIAGGGDQQCAALGVGVTRSGRVKATTGTGTFLLAFLEESKRDPHRRVLCSCHAFPGKYVYEASIFTTGSILRWFRDEFSSAEKTLAPALNLDSYDLLGMQAETIPPGSEGILLLPHFTGAGAPHWDPSARGLIFGLSLGHSRNHLIRAIMEATCYEIKTNLEVFKELGVELTELRITGGATRNSVWNQIEADICNIPVMKGKVEEATALGAAILAGVGAGAFKNIEQASEKMVVAEERKYPDPARVKKYRQFFDIYSQLYSSLKESGLYEKLADISS